MTEENLNNAENLHDAQAAETPEAETNATDGAVQGDVFAVDSNPPKPTSETGSGSDTPAPPQPIPVDDDAEAIKAAAIASGTYYLTKIYNEKVDNTHAKVGNEVGRIIRCMEHKANMLREDVIAIWDRVENEFKAIL